MDKRIILIILAVLFIAATGAALKFFLDNQALINESEALKGENGRLLQENDALSNQKQAAESKLREAEDRFGMIQNQLIALERERAQFESEYKDAVRQRDMLAEKLKEQPTKIETRIVEVPVQPRPTADGMVSDEYWADYVKARAELEARLDNLRKDLGNAKVTIADYEKRNKELSLKIDELTKEQVNLTKDMEFKARTVEVMSRDLVKERESRKTAVSELEKMRGENISLKRELILANKEKVQLQENLNNNIQKKEELEQMIGEVENVFKDKKMALEELQEQLSQAINSEKQTVGTQSTTAVSLPPIVVKPENVGVSGVKGEVIAVNQAEKFIVVDRGEASGIRPGMYIKVSRSGVDIATAEIVEARKDISAADIKEVIGGYSIREGDVIVTQ